MNDDIMHVVVIPVCAALITGFFCGVLLLVIGTLAGWPWEAAAIGGVGVALLTWWAWSARFAAVLQHQLAPDLPQEPEPQEEQLPQTINLHLTREDDGYYSGQFLDRLPLDDNDLAALASDAINGRSLATSARPGGLDRPTWEALRDRFISAGLLQWRSGNRRYGVELTLRGMTIFRRLANDAPTPTGENNRKRA